jgi:hypothetical protein
MDPQVADRACTLVSAGCTTGWADWIHGELWLCPDGLLRRSLGLMATIRHAVFPTVKAHARPMRSFSQDEIDEIVMAHRTNRFVPWQTVEEARLGVARLDVWTTDGRKMTFMWVPLDDVSPLRETLPEVLDGHLRAD